MHGVAVVLCCLLAAAAAGPPVAKSRQQIEELKEALEKSREDDGLLLEDRMEEHPEGNEWANSGKFQGDIVLDDEQIEDIVTSYATGGRMAYVRPHRRWAHNTVVYEWGLNEFNVQQQRHIRGAMDALEANTCVRFRLRNNNDRHWVRVTGRPTGCYANVGWWEPRQISTLNLARNNPGHGCLNFVVIIHELMHNLGFWHMQSTYNRYNYVRIHWENIQQGMAHNFYSYDQSIVSNLRLPYEYGSCMHYGTHFFSRNGRPTISTTRHYSGVLGQTVRVTGWDIWRIARHYNCPGAWSSGALEKARTTVYEVADNGVDLTEKKVDNLPLADELEVVDADGIYDDDYE